MQNAVLAIVSFFSGRLHQHVLLDIINVLLDTSTCVTFFLERSNKDIGTINYKVGPSVKEILYARICINILGISMCCLTLFLHGYMIQRRLLVSKISMSFIYNISYGL